ncbi:MAG: hypothetical protein KDK70_09695 [Myxococcales bacterium]|nr:hypothetical protein [Myxococcales bacterium]
MPDHAPAPPLDEIALEYARHWGPLELARRQFLEQRDALLDTLADSLASALQGQPVVGDRAGSSSDEFAERYYEVDGEFAAALRQRGIDGRVLAGVQISGRVASKGPLEVCAELYFRMRHSHYGELLEIIREQAATLGVGAHHGDHYAILTVARVRVDSPEFTLEHLRSVVKRLPEAFTVADRTLARAFLDRDAEGSDRPTAPARAR